MNKIAILGCGNIGSRHLQSCLELDSETYEIYVLEPAQLMQQKARELVSCSENNISITWLEKVEQLPEEIDVAIIATSSAVRRNTTLKLLAKTKVTYLIFEKFLFQDVESFFRVEEALESQQVQAFVNCPLRVWPVYDEIANRLRNETVSNIHVDIIGDDIGCNGIHSLDLISFILGSSEYTVENFDLQKVKPSKREGYLKTSGILRGQFQCSDEKIPFEINARAGDYIGCVTKIDVLGKGDIISSWSGASVTLSGSFAQSFNILDWDAPYQSALTASYITNLIDTERSKLTSYANSKSLHLPLLTSLLDELNKQNILLNPKICPIT